MFRTTYAWMILLAGVMIGLVVSGRFVVLAQDRSAGKRPAQARPSQDITIEPPRASAGAGALDDRRPEQPGPEATASRATVQGLLLRPYRFPFSRPTSLTRVCAHLGHTLGVPVVLDLAALGRQDVEPEDTVQLELDGVRLKTGLKLLLDQVGLTFHVVPEDNLLVITDRDGSEDPLDRIWSELRALHRDVHDVRDAIDDLSDSASGEKAEGPRVRKPTIIEEMPDHEAGKPGAARDKPEGPVKTPDGARGTGPRATPSRVPLGRPRRSL
jgi:hypothetical protein